MKVRAAAGERRLDISAMSAPPMKAGALLGAVVEVRVTARRVGEEERVRQVEVSWARRVVLTMFSLKGLLRVMVAVVLLRECVWVV